MVKPGDVRTRLQRQLDDARARKEQVIDTGCEHDWKRFKQTLPIDNLNFKRFNAYFILKGCTKCKAKLLIDYIVE